MKCMKIAAALVMMVSVAAAQAAIPIFDKLAQKMELSDFRATIKGAGVMEGDDILLDRVGEQIFDTFKKELNEAAAADQKSIATALVKEFGERMPIGQFHEQAKIKNIYIPDAVLKTVPVPAVAAASAPIVPAPAVAQAPTPAAKSAPVAKTEPDVMTHTEFLNSVKDLNKKIEGNSDARVDFYERRISQLAQGLEEKAVAGFKLKAAQALLKNEPALLAKVNNLMAAKDVQVKAELSKETEARKAQIGAVNDHLSRTDGAVTNISSRVGLIEKYGYGIIAVLVLLIVAGVFLWFRTSAARKEAKATVDATRSAIKAAETRAAETVRTVKADVAYAVEEAEAARKQVGIIHKRVEDVAARAHLVEMNFTDEELESKIYALPVPGTCVFEFTADGKPFTLHIERTSATCVKVHGIRDQRNEVKIDNLAVRIKRAARNGDLLGITPLQDVIKLPMKAA